ncbi:MAG: LLM class F420-dependent oxidoreductase [Myxococcales bacterium]|nr:LLM class F420-dependent oxidoreductase [Myxococcales bacterium]MCZ6713778.1 LLM class F420-dependent oxidoreductase [Deltaproteobacteria bacterium]TDJ00680.1 MAG: LLM class F420-dependent oxidoreductase [Deltaproteobacteria bacterium]TDJ07584.1 MAG: LLM class F420-dependent oxidoreductase [Deltaproteobacteria bacterium]
MRFSVQLPTEKVEPDHEFLSAAAVAEMAQAAEAAGFDACFVTDHPMPDDRFLGSGGHHSLDPFVALSFAAAVTTRLRLLTYVLVLPYRNPFLTAKAASSLDVLSGGRLLLGVAAGYLEGEFAALGADFDERNERTDEAIGAIRRAWTEDGVRLEGKHFKAVGNTMRPRPLQRPHPPIWVGGNSKRAIRRAVELGDGWLPFPAPRQLARYIRTASMETLSDLEKGIAYAREHAEAIGRSSPLDISFVPFGLEMFGEGTLEPDRFLEQVAELERMGVTWLAVTLSCESRAEYCERVSAFGEQILSKLQRS